MSTITAPLTIFTGKIGLDCHPLQFPSMTLYRRRQSMFSSNAWKRHGCYRLGSEQYFNMPLTKSLTGCMDDWNALDHFDVTANTRRVFKRFFELRDTYVALRDGFGLRHLRKWTYEIKRPGSNNTATEMGAWAMVRELLLPSQNDSVTATGYSGPVMLMFSNENHTTTYTHPCTGQESNLTPFPAGSIRNLFPPYETITTTATTSLLYPGSENNATAGCIPSIEMDAWGFKAFVPATNWIGPRPAITKFSPGHDHRILSQGSTVQISLEFNVVMECASVTQSISFDVTTTGGGGAPTIGTPSCGEVTNPDPNVIPGGEVSTWSWSATLQNVPDGIIRMTVNNPTSDGGDGTQVCGLLAFYVDSILMIPPGH